MSEQPGPAAQIGGMIFAVLLIDGEATIMQINHATENLLGKSEKRLVGNSLADALDLSESRVLERLADSDAALVARYVGLKAGGREIHVNLTVSPISTHSGWRVVTLSDAGRDDEAREDERLLSNSGAPSILAHEIKNPLSAIRGAGQLIERKLGDADRPLARMITDEVDRIARLIDRMQQLGSDTSDPVEPVNLHEAVRSAIATVRTATGGSIPIEEEFDPSLPPVMANPDALEQVVINLVSNACEACGGGEAPKVTVRTRFVSGLAFSAIRFGRKVRLPIEITVSDNGPGVDEAMRNHIFEPFVSSKKSGQGLGLALVRKLVRDMDGNISHERDQRAGLTNFRIHLAMASEEAAA